MPEDRDAYSGQRLVDIADLPAEPRIRNAVRADGAVRIDWDGEGSNGVLPTFDGCAPIARKHRSRGRNCGCAPGSKGSASMRGGISPGRAWPRSQSVPGARLTWLTRLVQDGLAFLEDVPAREERDS